MSSAREIDDAFATARAPDLALVMRLARAVLDFQQHLAGARDDQAAAGQRHATLKRAGI